MFNTLKSEQNDCHYVGDNVECVFSKENIWVLIHIFTAIASQMFKGQYNSIIISGYDLAPNRQMTFIIPDTCLPFWCDDSTVEPDTMGQSVE